MNLTATGSYVLAREILSTYCKNIDLCSLLNDFQKSRDGRHKKLISRYFYSIQFLLLKTKRVEGCKVF